MPNLVIHTLNIWEDCRDSVEGASDKMSFFKHHFSGPDNALDFNKFIHCENDDEKRLKWGCTGAFDVTFDKTVSEHTHAVEYNFVTTWNVPFDWLERVIDKYKGILQLELRYHELEFGYFGYVKYDPGPPDHLTHRHFNNTHDDIIKYIQQEKGVTLKMIKTCIQNNWPPDTPFLEIETWSEIPDRYSRTDIMSSIANMIEHLQLFDVYMCYMHEVIQDVLIDWTGRS